MEPNSNDSSSQHGKDATTLEEMTDGFVENLSRRMEALGLSQAELADRMEVSAAYVNKIIHGKANLTMASLLRLANALETEVSVLLDPPTPQPADPPPPTEETEAPDPQDTTATSSPSAQARALREHLKPEALKKVVAFETANAKPRGRPKGSGRYDDDHQLQEMARLIVMGEARSERKASEMVAAPGPYKKATVRRLRRKYAERRDALAAEARARLQPQEASPDRSQHRSPRRAPSTCTGAQHAPLSARAITSAFVDELVQEHQLDRKLADQLRSPYVLEEVAQLSDPSGDLFRPTDISVANPQATAPWTPPTSAATRTWEPPLTVKDVAGPSPAEISDRINEPRRLIDEMNTLGRLDRQINEATKPR